jgi:hypothetical protein
MGFDTHYAYDDLGRQTQADYDTVSSPYYETTRIVTEYDANNNVTKITETKTGAGGTLTDITENTDYEKNRGQAEFKA